MNKLPVLILLRRSLQQQAPPVTALGADEILDDEADSSK